MRSINFIGTRIFHESKLVRFVALHGLFHCPCSSMFLIGQNAWFCAGRYILVILLMLSIDMFKKKSMQQKR